MFEVVNRTGTKEDSWRESIMDAVDSCDATRLEELLKAIGNISKPYLDFTTRSDGLLTEFRVRYIIHSGNMFFSTPPH